MVSRYLHSLKIHLYNCFFHVCLEWTRELALKFGQGNDYVVIEIVGEKKNI